MARVGAFATRSGRRSHPSWDGLDTRAVRVAIAIAAVLAGITALFAAGNPLRFALVSDELDLTAHTMGALVCAAVAALSYARYRQNGGAEGLLQAAAFVVLATANVVNVLVVILGLDRVAGLALDAPGQLPLYAWAAAQLAAASLLAAGALANERASGRLAPHARAVLWSPSILLLPVTGLLWAARDVLPILVDPATLRRLAEESFATSPLGNITLGIVALDGAAAALFVVGAAGYAKRDRGTSGIPRTYLVAGLVIAAFSQVHFILYPAIYSGLVSTGDSLRIAFYLVLIAGIHAGTTADVRALRSANARLQMLAAAEADRTAIAERARLARELHDGLAQHLWSTKLEFDRLSSELDDPSPAIAVQVVRVGEALDTSVREARDAVNALRGGFDAGLSFTDELPRRLDAFVDRTGYVVDLDFDPGFDPLPGVIAADVLRIIDEALHNVQKHADATRVRVRVAATAGGLTVTVQDNGRGFTLARPATGHGIAGMRERAALVGGRLNIRSAPGDGTSVSVWIPTDRAGL